MTDQDENVYQVETLIGIFVTFYNTQTNQPADPTAVSLFIEDPNGNVTQVAPNLISRGGVGAYFAQFLPTSPGRWTHKWRGTGNVVATSKDVSFFVRASDLVS